MQTAVTYFGDETQSATDVEEVYQQWVTLMKRTASLMDNGDMLEKHMREAYREHVNQQK